MKINDIITESKVDEAAPLAGAIGGAAVRYGPRIANAVKKGADAVKKSDTVKKLKKWGDEILDVALDGDGANNHSRDEKSLGDIGRDAAEWYRKTQGKQNK